MIASWMSPYLSGLYAYARDKEIEKALSDSGYDIETACRLIDEGHMALYRSAGNDPIVDTTTIYLDGRELFRIEGRYWSGGPLKQWTFKRETKKDAHI